MVIAEFGILIKFSQRARLILIVWNPQLLRRTGIVS
jgi:hypothetical protein